MSEPELLGIEVARGHVLAEWIDINNHMNVAYYVLAFDQGVDQLWERFGLTNDYIDKHNSSTFAVESHIIWKREIAEAEPYFVTSQILAFDEKRIHQFMRMYHADNRHLVATAEWMNLHVDLDRRRVAPWPDDIRQRIASFAEQQGAVGWPSEAGKTMSLDKPLYSAKASDE